MASGKSINCPEDRSYMRLSSPCRCFYSFLCCITLMFLHELCTVYFFIFASKPSICQIFVPKINTINLHSLIWGNQHQPLIYNMSSSEPSKLEKLNIPLILSLLIERASSEHEIHLVCRSTRSLVVTVDLCSLYHFPRIEILTFFALVQFAELSTTIDLSPLLSQPPDLSIN